MQAVHDLLAPECHTVTAAAHLGQPAVSRLTTAPRQSSAPYLARVTPVPLLPLQVSPVFGEKKASREEWEDMVRDVFKVRARAGMCGPELWPL